MPDAPSGAGRALELAAGALAALHLEVDPAGGQADAMAIADALWLAALRTPAIVQAPPDQAPPDQAPPDYAPARAEPGVREAQEASRPYAPQPTALPAVGMPPGGGVYQRFESPASAPGTRGRPVLVARARPLPRALDLARSLRPFNRPWASGRTSRLDLAATVEGFARSGELIPVFEPAPERWFEAVVVADRSPSMAVWRDTVDEFRQVLHRSGAFRKIHAWDLGALGDRLTLRGPGGQAIGSEQVRSSDGRRMVLVVSDCGAPWWRDDRAWQLLRDWASTVPTALVNPLPPRLWRYMGLSLPAVRATPAAAAGRPNTALRYRRPLLLRPGGTGGDWIPMPVAALTPHSVARWARTLMNTDDCGCDAVLLPAPGLLGGADDSSRTPGAGARSAAPGDAGTPDRGLVARFRDHASSNAVRLAVLSTLLGDDMIDLPLLHLIAERLVPGYTVSDVAEVIVSGLFTVAEDERASVTLRFRDGVPGQLRRLLGAQDYWRLREALSRHVAARRPVPVGFPAIVADPEGDRAVPSGAPAFAAAPAGAAGMPPDAVPVPSQGGPDDERVSQAVPDESSADLVALPSRPRVLIGAGNVQVNNYYPQGNFEVLSNALQPPPETYYDFLDLARFTGRRELIDQVNEFIVTHRHGWVVIQGEAGVGKSALAAQLVSSNDWFYHFTWFTGAKNPENARKNLAAQLISVFRLDQYAPGGNLPSTAAEPKFLADVLQDAAAERDKVAQGRPIVLVIDTLADIDPENRVVTPLGIPSAEELPRKVFVVVTRRPGPPPLTSVGEPLLQLPITLDEDRERARDRQLNSTNTRDMREYLSRLLDGPEPDRELLEALHRSHVSPGEFADALVNRCTGVWIYLKYVLEDVRAGRRDPADVESLPYGLRYYYRRQIERQRKGDLGKWTTLRLPALATLAALRRPVTDDKLASLIGISDAADLAELSAWLNKDIRAFLHKDMTGDDPSHEIRHQSLRDLVAAPGAPGQAADPDDPLSRELPRALRAAHEAITADLIPPDGDWSTAGQYVRSTLAEHAAYAGRLDELVTDPGFLLICQPASVLLHRRDLKTPDGFRAVSAYEAALNEWAQLPPDPGERAWRLHIWARKTGAAQLAVACCAIAGRTPVIQAAMWTGTTHRTMPAHTGSVGAVTVLPTGDERPLLASGGSDGLVRLWDPDAAAPVGDPLVACDDWVMAAAAVPSPEGHLLATGAKDGSVWFWSPHDTRPFAAPRPGHRGPVTAIAAVRQADGRTLLATAGRDGKIRLWDPATRTDDGDPLTVVAGWVTAAAPMPAPAGQLLATGTDAGRVQLWDLSTRRPAGDPMTGHQGPVEAIAAAGLADGRTVIATGGGDGMRIWFWDAETSQPAEGPITHATGPVTAITVARLANRTFFATAGQDRKIRLWDAATGAAESLSLSVHARWVNSIVAVLRPHGGLLLATGGSNGKIEFPELYESATGTIATAFLGRQSGHIGQVTALTATELAGRPVIASGSRDGTVRLWDPLSGDAIEDPLTGRMGPLRAIAAVPLADRRNLIATSDTDGKMEVWDLTTSPPTCRPLDHYAQVYAITAVRLADSATLLAIGGGNGTLRLWDPLTGEPVGTPLAGHGGQRINAITSARLTSGQTLLVTGGSDGTVQLWDAGTRAASGDPLNWQIGRIRAVAAVPMPDGHTMFAAGGDDGVVQIWDGAGRGALVGPPAAQRAPVNAITAVEFPGRTMLAIGGGDGMVRLWDPVTGEPAVTGGSWVGHSGPVRALASVRLPGGPTLVASGGDDKTILIWTFG